VVHYGPPLEAIEAVRAALARSATHEYHDGAGLPALLDRIVGKLSADNRIDATRGAASWSPPGPTWPSCTRPL
jgi:hypothetical protein